ncbi:restriction endonuclease subunit S [Cuspidothrix issatschenkoi LEGE 03284]|uniref:restriction endonuclease subunit S n=1 Tax=Cuspidothrix issatschenkoi TaxID=230752 RepID=UPI001881F842|nr:restriction endonuclease subunit S [Cuspidothrix issatschenkoi]MBE9233587.1 restriction endonuclease subunit S [Cuspidothrix issatschenkoi LEGE 03284]
MEVNWHSGKLADLAEILMGQSPSGETCNSQYLGIPLLNGPTEFTSHHPIPVQFTIDPKKIAEPDDILFCVRGSTTGRMNWSDQKYAIGRGIAAIRHKQGSEYKHFVRGLLEFKLPLLLTIATGSTFPNISKEQLLSLPCDIPPLSEQKAIAHILSSLDDKIELNRQMNETLEAMARAIFKSWFVDFDPVRAKKSGRQPAGMDAATADLFPDDFEESSLGLIPKGWRVKKLGDLAQNISRKFDFSKKTEVIFINTGDILLGRFLHSNRISKEGLPGQAKKSICENDILMSEIRPANGRYAYVDFDSSDYVVSTKFMVIHALDEIEPRLLYRILTLPVTLTELQVVAESRSGTFPQITFDSINYLPIILPPKTIQLAFLRIVSLLEEQIKVNDLQSNTLTTIRDTLLPKLMSGQIRVKEAEKIMEKLT